MCYLRHWLLFEEVIRRKAQKVLGLRTAEFSKDYKFLTK